MATLSSYVTQVRRLLHDPNAQFYQQADLQAFVNLARSHVAREGRCIELLLSGGTVTGFTSLVGGSGYSSQTTVTLTGQGVQAFATPVVAGGIVTGINLSSGGYGYLTPPAVTITDPGGGTGASAIATVDNSVSTVVGQEIYKLSTFSILAALTPGVRSVLGVISLAAQWGAGNTYKPTLRQMVWSEFQEQVRIFANSQVNFPAIWATLGQGTAKQIYLYPIPSQVLSMDAQTWCLPADLANDTTVEAIPDPWTEAVQYYAAYLAFSNSQRKADADRMETYYKTELITIRSTIEPDFIPDPYPDDMT